MYRIWEFHTEHKYVYKRPYFNIGFKYYFDSFYSQILLMISRHFFEDAAAFSLQSISCLETDQTLGVTHCF